MKSAYYIFIQWASGIVADACATNRNFDISDAFNVYTQLGFLIDMKGITPKEAYDKFNMYMQENN